MKTFSKLVNQLAERAMDPPDTTGLDITIVPSHPAINQPPYRIIGMNYDICWYLSQPKPDHLAKMVTHWGANIIPNEGGEKNKWNNTPWTVKNSWKDIAYRRLSEGTAIAYWYKGEIPSDIMPKVEAAFLKMVACPNRAAWASSPSGKAYRGVRRDLSIIKKFKFTGEVVQMGGKFLFAIAKGTYQPKNLIQSWSSSITIAHNFAVPKWEDMGSDWGSAAGENRVPRAGQIAVIYSVMIPKEQTLFSPKASKEISWHGDEAEIIRVSKKPLPVTAYVKINEVVEAAMGGKVKDMNQAKKFASDVFGQKAAEQLLKSKEFLKEIGIT